MNGLAEALFDLEVSALGRGLRSSWEEQERVSDMPITRSLTLNLIAVSHAEHEQRLLTAIERLLVRHPCRSFLIIIDDTATKLCAQLKSYTRQHRLNRSLQLELVHLRVPSADVPKLSNLILPLLINDLPTQLYWGEGIHDDLKLIGQLGAIADQLVYDSSLFVEPVAEIALLESFALESTDMTWMRLSPWRRGLAEAFEHFEWQAEAGTRVEIHHAQSAGALAAAHLIGEWLKARLNAEVVFNTSGDSDACDFVPTRIDLRHSGVEIELQHNPSTSHIRAKVSTPNLCLVPYDLVTSDSSRGDLLAAAADRCWTR